VECYVGETHRTGVDAAIGGVGDTVGSDFEQAEFAGLLAHRLGRGACGGRVAEQRDYEGDDPCDREPATEAHESGHACHYPTTA
jgi:hypothetical protein